MKINAERVFVALFIVVLIGCVVFLYSAPKKVSLEDKWSFDKLHGKMESDGPTEFYLLSNGAKGIQCVYSTRSIGRPVGKAPDGDVLVAGPFLVSTAMDCDF